MCTQGHTTLFTHHLCPVRSVLSGFSFFLFPAMMCCPCSSSLPAAFLVHLLLLVFSAHVAETRSLGEKREVHTSSLPALFVFGDSTVDSGNNNHINTASRSNFPPYGRDFPNHTPTGRFSNGKLVTDFVASYAGLKEYIPAYLDPTLSLDDLKIGACFASASSGFDPLTAQLAGVISMQNQLQYFREYKSRMEGHIGKERTESMISKGVFLISAGTNDFIVNYYGAPIRRQTHTISGYQQFILELGQQFLQGLLEMGARNIALAGLPPMGCLPVVITLNSDSSLSHRGCIESLSSVAQDYNRLLQSKLAAVQSHRAQIFYFDIYKPLDNMIKKPQQFGFEKVNCGCCGSGMIESAYTCNPYSIVCSDDSRYVFWDAIHPTEAAYYNIFQSARPTIDRFLKG